MISVDRPFSLTIHKKRVSQSKNNNNQYKFEMGKFGG